MIYCCVLTVYNTLYKFVNTQQDGFCQKKKNRGCTFYVAQHGSCRGSFIAQKSRICRQFTVRFLPSSSTYLTSYESLECSKFPADASGKTAVFKDAIKLTPCV